MTFANNMKTLVITISFIAIVVSCQKPHRATTEPDKASDSGVDPTQPQPQDSTTPEPLKEPTIRHEGRVYSLKEWNEFREKEDAISRAALKASEAEYEERMRIHNLPPFEEALELKGSKSIASAFIVRSDQDKKLSIVKGVFGKIPTDFSAYITLIQPSKSYLAGAVMPKSGYGINIDREEERFCIPLTIDDKFTDGGGLSRAFSVEEVERLLKK